MNETKRERSSLRPASTVILVRERNREPQVYLLKRSEKSGFMAGKYVFPGGTLDAPDMRAAFWRRHVDLDMAAAVRKLGGGLAEEDILAYGVAAIRETLEEAGVFLARKRDEDPEGFRRVRDLRLQRDTAGEWFIDLVEGEQWRLHFSKLARWAQWITPKLMKQRYDTRFFLAFMPPDQQCVPDARETVDGIWVTPEQGLAGNLSGEIPLSPPTLITLHQLLAYSRFSDLADEAASRPWGDAMAPDMVMTQAGPVILEPWDPEWGCDAIDADVEHLSGNIVPVGEPVSRIWLHQGLWRPVRARAPIKG